MTGAVCVTGAVGSFGNLSHPGEGEDREGAKDAKADAKETGEWVRFAPAGERGARWRGLAGFGVLGERGCEDGRVGARYFSEWEVLGSFGKSGGGGGRRSVGVFG